MKKITLILLMMLIGGYVQANDHEAKSEGHGEAKQEEVGEVSDDPNLKIFKLEEAGSDIRVPTKIWDDILGNAKKSSDEITFSNIRVRFKEKNAGVLIEPEFVVDLPRGGGEIDLFRFVTEKQGTFRVFFEAHHLENAKKAHVFYVSKARKRKLDGEVWGLGCKKYLDLTNFIQGKAAKDGIEVNTTRARHLSVLMGHFIFAADKKMAQVTFKDSSQPNLNCDAAPESK